MNEGGVSFCKLVSIDIGVESGEWRETIKSSDRHQPPANPEALHCHPSFRGREQELKADDNSRNDDMPSGSSKKRPTSNKKKRQQQRGDGKKQPHQKPPSLEEILAKAEASLEASDVETACGLFAYAADVLRSRLDGTSSAGIPSSSISAMNEDEIKSLLSRVLGKAGEARVSLGDPDGGRENFEEAIELLGSTSTMDEEMEGSDAADQSSAVADAQLCEARAGLHLYLGQLSSEKDALASYQAGVKDLERCVKILDRLASAGADAPMEEDGGGEAFSLKPALAETRRQLGGAYCSILELFMTDLCFEPDAEEQCEAMLASAMAIDDGTAPDALQAKANLRLTQRRGEEAVHSILDAYSRMKVGCEAMADLVGLGKEDGAEGEAGQKMAGGNNDDDEEDKAKELVEIDAASALPGFEFRCQTSKILLECAAVLGDSDRGGGEDNGGSDENDARRNACVESAIQVLGSLLAENDEVVEVWYLLGCAFETMTPTNVDAAKYYWETALTMLAKVKEGMDQAGPDEVDEEEKQCIIDQTNEIKERLDTMLDEAEEDGDMDE